MIARSIVNEVRRLLAEGKRSHRKIAQMTGISRGSVGAIASGRRPDYAACQREEDSCDEPLGPPARCPGCGGMVTMPCRLCRARQSRSPQQRTRPHNESFNERLELNLRPEQHARYEEVRAARRRTGSFWETEKCHD